MVVALLLMIATASNATSSSPDCRFRQEYRLERKLLSSFDEEDLTADLSSLLEPRAATTARSISRVVVLHNDKLATFSDSTSIDGQVDFFDTPEFWSGSITWW